MMTTLSISSFILPFPSPLAPSVYLLSFKIKKPINNTPMSHHFLIRPPSNHPVTPTSLHIFLYTAPPPSSSQIFFFKFNYAFTNRLTPLLISPSVAYHIRHRHPYHILIVCVGMFSYILTVTRVYPTIPTHSQIQYHYG